MKTYYFKGADFGELVDTTIGFKYIGHEYALRTLHAAGVENLCISIDDDQKKFYAIIERLVINEALVFRNRIEETTRGYQQIAGPVIFNKYTKAIAWLEARNSKLGQLIMGNL